ncbi:MAG: class I SAM-dependent methyltransferase [Bacteroidota bacterium]
MSASISMMPFGKQKQGKQKYRTQKLLKHRISHFMPVSKEFDPPLSHRYYFIRKGLLTAIKKHAPALTGKLLDFGCGSKPYQSLFKLDEYIGLDFEKTGHDHSNEQIDVYYDGKTIPFNNEYFDSILCSEVAEHLFDLPAAFAEINRVLKKGGKLLLTCPFVWNEHEAPYDYARYTQFALKDMLEKNDFSIVQYEKKGDFIEAITQMRVLYFVQWAEPFLSKLSYPGSWLLRASVFLINGWGSFKNWLLPAKYELYLSNIVLAEKK